MKSIFLKHPKNLFIMATLLLSLLVTFAACGDSGSGGNTPAAKGTGTTIAGTSNSPTPTTGNTTTGAAGGDSTPAIPPGVTLGAQPCPDAVKDPAHWDPIIPTQSGTSQVESVICGNLQGNPTLQALVKVRSAGTGASLDVYVFNNITSASPVSLFKLLNLYKGDAKISGYNTVLTSEVDANSSVNNGKANAELIADLFREFKWSDGAGTFVPVAFPGIFPDLTRYQAETDQANVNAGHQPWKLSATMTAQALAANANLLKWDPNAPTTVLSGGGANDLKAIVQVKNTLPVGGTIQITLYRLEGNKKNGIWEATSVESKGLTIATPEADSSITTPVSVTGTGSAFEGVIGKLVVLDHLYTDIGHAQAMGAIGNGNTTFSTNVTYSASFHGGFQEGMLALFAYSNANGSIASAVLVKELISA